jgi:fermentation-respiration switch protein FrsA (DUF1100 family)
VLNLQALATKYLIMRMLWTVILVLSGVYTALALVLFFLQSRLVHLPNMPGRELMATPQQIGLNYESISLMTDDGIKLHGWYIPAQKSQGTLLFFHGNAGNISHRLESLVIFNRLGLDVLIFDYRGYGRSEGTPSEEGLYKDAEAALRYLREEHGLAMGDIIFFGRSLGGSVAAWLAARYPPAALIIESSFTSAQDMAAELYPFLPTRLLTRLHYDTLKNIQAVRSPVLIVHSRDDEIIPFQQGRKLFAAAQEPKRFLEIRGKHNEGFLESRRNYEKGIQDFLAWIKMLSFLEDDTSAFEIRERSGNQSSRFSSN